MSDEINHGTEAVEEKQSGHRCKRKRCGKRGGCGRVVFGILAVIGVVWLAGAAFGPGCGYAGWHHSAHHWGDAAISQRMERMSEHLIDHVDASESQAEQIKAITASYAARLQPVRASMLEQRENVIRILTATDVNRGELEAVRQSAFDQLNHNSQELVQMVADIADLLTPEQRQKLAEHADKRWHHFQ